MSNATVVSTINDLENLLTEYFEERIKTKTDVIANSVMGRLDGKKFRINFMKDHYMMLFVEENSFMTIKKLQPILTEVMDSKTPICVYSLKRTDTYNLEEYLTMEWDIKHPDERIRALVNERGFQNAEVFDIRLFNSRRISDYKDNLDWLDKLNSCKFYGRDIGNIENIEKVNNADEVDLFLMIYDLSRELTVFKHSIPVRISYVDLTLSQFALEYMIYQTKKFGVEVSEPKEGRHIIPGPSYNAWFNFYKTNIIDVYTREEIEAYKVLKSNGKDVSFFTPKGRWNEEAKNLVIKESTPTN